MNKITISSPRIKDNRITYSYQVEGEWAEAFNLNEEFYIEYNCDISTVPEGIAVVPLICNILPMAWIYDAQIDVPMLDKAFYDCIPNIKRGYMDMHPSIDFKGSINVGEIQENKSSLSGRAACFFSGGVDAFNTLIMHHDEKPDLVTLWGSDVKLDDFEGWGNVETHVKHTAKKFGVNSITVKSSFRMFLNYNALNKVFKQYAKGNWWHEMQHGIGIISHGAPIAYINGYSTMYIASSYTASDGDYTCASDPTIDNHVRFGQTKIVHDGYHFTRQDKVENIVAFSRKTNIYPTLRVCWISTGGRNCCKCEKCWRTVFALIAEGANPHNYGFDYSNIQMKNAIKVYRRGVRLEYSELTFYKYIQNRMKEKYTIKDIPKELRWFYRTDMNKLGEYPWYLWGVGFSKRIKNRVAKMCAKRSKIEKKK